MRRTLGTSSGQVAENMRVWRVLGSRFRMSRICGSKPWGGEEEKEEKEWKEERGRGAEEEEKEESTMSSILSASSITR